MFKWHITTGLTKYYQRLMSSISVKYSLVWRFVKHHHIQVTRCRKVFNIKTNKQLKCCLNGGSLGYWIDKDKFVPLSKINKEIEKIPKDDLKIPF